MEAEDLSFDDCCEGKKVEKVGEVFPYVGVPILAKAFIIETIDLGNLTRFMVSSEDGQSVLESHFKAYKQGYCLHRIITSVYIVSHEKVISVWSLAA
jgi:hypothetical protein